MKIVDRSEYFMEMQRIWMAARRVIIDPEGTLPRSDDFGRIISFHDFGQSNLFGWMTVRMGAEDIPLNNRSIVELAPKVPMAVLYK